MSQVPFHLPPYTHIPGKTPHPFSDPQGHSYGQHDQKEIDEKSMFEHALFLFENGYFWEAHEAWEQVWISLERRGPEADLIKGFIKLAACGVKCLEENRVGAERHLKRALELLSSEKIDSTKRFASQLPNTQKLIEQMRRRIEALSQPD
ncbi:DUF309 domain-containing protein [Thalassoglobus sp.]|uniref:DUF309 domain-containing protein n=1 Tax=Thalassoglobus sp. TaxID=2795869 RepID=UPI003AA98739